MKIAITSTGPTMDAALDPRFGRCAYFVLVETDDMSFAAVPNESGALGGGAGIQSAKAVSKNDVVAVLTGSCGPNAHQALSAAGIDVVVGVSGTVRDAAARYAAGELCPTSGPNVPSHSGMGASGR